MIRNIVENKYDYHLSGKILPERVDYNINLPVLNLVEPQFGYNFDIAVSIQRSQISVDITSKTEITDINTLRNIVRDFIRLHTDSFGYLHGYAYEIEITSFSGRNNIPHKIYGVQIDEIEDDYPNRPISEDVDVAKLMYEGANNELRISLNDLRLAIQHPGDTGVFCFRAIESLMQYFGSKNDATWNQFRSTLNVSRSFLKPIEDKSWSRRHGKPVPITHSERVDIMKRTWKVVDRFILFILNSAKALDKTQHPEL